MTALHSSEVQRRYREERRQANDLKTKDDYGFVVGNPPYVRIQNIAKGQARKDYDDYSTAHYNYDLYVLFLERSAGWLADDRKLGFIVSNKFIHNRYGEKFRNFIIQNYQLEEMINFGDVSVFPAVQSYPVILVGERINKNELIRSAEEFTPEEYTFTYAAVRDALPEITQTAVNGEGENGSLDYSPIADIISAHLPANPGDSPPTQEEALNRSSELVSDASVPESLLDVFPVQSLMLASEEWKFVPYDEGEVLKSMDTGGQSLGEFPGETIARKGVQTGANDVFIVGEGTIEKYNLEGDIVHPLVAGEDVHR